MAVAVVGMSLFVFQAEDGIRDIGVTGVQTCALPIYGRVHVLYNPIDVERFTPDRLTREAARAQLGLPPDAPLIAVVAQITPWKGQDVAVRADRKSVV